jgi:hypothetical protein
VTVTNSWGAKAVSAEELAAAVTPAVALAISELRSRFGAECVVAWPEASGGAWVVIDGVDIGSFWTPTTTWLGFLISYLHPDADCYPHFIGPEVARVDGKPMTPPLNPGQVFSGMPATMISRSSPRRKKVETPADKADKVISFLRSQK